MKKILSLIVISLFVMSGLAFADSSWTYENVDILGTFGGGTGNTPPVMIVRVSVGSEDDVVVGDVMVWDLSNALDDADGELGFTVRRCDINSASNTQDGDTGQFTTFAGVMVTTASADSGDRGIGYMAIRGFCDAKISYSDAKWKGRPLVLTGNNMVASFGTADGHAATGAATNVGLSEDIGVLLEDVGTDPLDGTGQLRKVWLK